jgi:hypothetical protein
MPRGIRAQDGDTNVSANGYHYTRVDGKWRFTHHIIAEEIIGRPINTETDVVRFKDKDNTNLDPSNIEVIPKGKSTPRKRLAEVRSKLNDLRALEEDLMTELGLKGS